MELNQQQALNILIKAAQVAQSKGAFTLDDAEVVNKAIKTFVTKEPVPSEINDSKEEVDTEKANTAE